MNYPFLSKPAATVVPKGWGEEVVIVNNEEYCGKILKFKKGARFSLHYHINKRETFFCLSGKLKVTSINLSNAEPYWFMLEQGEIIDIPRQTPHQLEALEESRIVEFSTHHEDSDSYRIAKGDSQQNTQNERKQ